MHGREVLIKDLGPLTQREGEALLWVAEGKTAWEAGTILGISEATTNAHIASAATKLRASNRAHLITRAFVEGILAPALGVLLMLSVLAAAFADELDDARMRRTCRRRDETSVAYLPSSEKKPRV